jgi:dCTP deaminase
MILSSTMLHKALDQKRIIITPEPSPRIPTIGSDHCPYDTHSVDLTLAPELSIPTKGSYVYDLKGTGIASFLARNSSKHIIDADRPFSLEPNTFILGRTQERVELPILPNFDTCLAARIEGKSSRARCGLLIHFTAPTVHPGFIGSLTLEIINLGASPILLRVGMPIAQLIVEEVAGLPASMNPSQFQGQTTPEGMPNMVDKK